MKVKTNPQLNPNPQPQNIQGMENFLNPSPNPQIPKTNLQNQTKLNSNPSTETKPTVANNDKIKEIEIEEEIKDTEQKLKNIKTLDLSLFNNIAFEKKIQFKLLFIRTKIYMLVRDSTGSRSTVIAVNPPRWGGSSLRFLILMCSLDWCQVVEKQTTKGKVLSYKTVDKAIEDNDEDIFD